MYVPLNLSTPHTYTHKIKQGQEFVLTSSSSTATEQKAEKKNAEGEEQQQEPPSKGKQEDRRAKEEPQDKAAVVAAPLKAASMKAAASGPIPEDLCRFSFTEIDPDCPRFISIDWRESSRVHLGPLSHPLGPTPGLKNDHQTPTGWVNWAGLGDRFLQYIVGLTYAIQADGACSIRSCVCVWGWWVDGWMDGWMDGRMDPVIDWCSGPST